MDPNIHDIYSNHGPSQAHHSRHSRQLLPQSHLNIATGPNGLVLDTGAAAVGHAMSTNDDYHLRRDSLNSSLQSPLSDPKWDRSYSIQTGDSAIRRTSFATSHSLHDDHASAFYSSLSASAPTASSGAMHQAASGWQHYEHPSGTASPLSFEPLSTSGDDYDAADFAHPITEDDSGLMSPHGSSAPIPFPPVNTGRASIDDSSLQSPLSPGSSNDLMMSLAERGSAHGRAIPRHMRPGYRPPRPSSTRSASDGVRKKNARIEIPTERTLGNIEKLIEKAADDDQVRELKAQRRLLRNREAALASRQRKKQYTETLESKEQNYIKQINSLTSDNARLQHHLMNLEANCNILEQKYTETYHAMNGLEMEKEELIMRHTQETANLRRKIQYLTEQLQNPEDFEHMVAPANIHDFTSDMNALTVDSQAWNPSAHQQQPVQTTQRVNLPGQSQQNPHVIPDDHANVQPIKRANEEPIASGVLFMILLCGAFVASKAHTNTVIPQMPDEVRVASSTVLDNLLKDPRAETFNQASAAATVPHPFDDHQQQQQYQQPFPPMTADGNRQAVFRSMTMPSTQQEAEQVFQLTPAEYQAYTSPEGYISHHQQANAPPKRNLAEALAGLRQESMTDLPPAEVYRRSLLWDQIPEEVVKQFKELVMDSKGTEETAEGHDGDARQMKHEYESGAAWPFSVQHT